MSVEEGFEEHFPLSHLTCIRNSLIDYIQFPAASLPVTSTDASSKFSPSCAGESLDLLHSGDNICVITKSITFKQAHLLWAPNKFAYCGHPLDTRKALHARKTQTRDTEVLIFVLSCLQFAIPLTQPFEAGTTSMSHYRQPSASFLQL